MIDRKPLKLGTNGARRADKAVRPTLGAGFGCAPALAALPAVQERCKVGVQEPAYGGCRFIGGGALCLLRSDRRSSVRASALGGAALTGGTSSWTNRSSSIAVTFLGPQRQLSLH
jgi:hypothetical protein